MTPALRRAGSHRRNRTAPAWRSRSIRRAAAHAPCRNAKYRECRGREPRGSIANFFDPAWRKRHILSRSARRPGGPGTHIDKHSRTARNKSSAGRAWERPPAANQLEAAPACGGRKSTQLQYCESAETGGPPALEANSPVYIWRSSRADSLTAKIKDYLYQLFTALCLPNLNHLSHNYFCSQPNRRNQC